MKADFSRGYNPDKKRNKEYRRVLLQQGRVLLDSDVAALVDANDRVLRNQSQDLGTEAGGHDRGYMLTAGKLYAVFRDLKNVLDPTIGPALIRHLDYGTRFKKRFPSLQLDTESPPSGGSARVKLYRPHARAQGVVLWLRSQEDHDPPQPGPETAAFLRGEGAVTYAGNLSNLVDHEFRRFVFTPSISTGSDSELVFTLASTRRIYVGMIESDAIPFELSGFNVPLWIEPGRFHAQGLLVENGDATALQSQLVPEPTTAFSFPNPATHAVGYLEAWERLVTAVQDNGIRERALSTGLDTSVRTQAIGQVKTFFVPETMTSETIRRAFADRFVPNGTFVVSTSPASTAESPCGISLEGGFTGRENYLYHFEVHSIAAGNQVTFKWSRQAGSELFPVHSFQLPSGGGLEFNVYVAPELGLRDGDLVEVLNDVVELGDDPAGAGSIDVNGKFVPPRRLVGSLALLKSVSSDQAGFDKFALREPATPTFNISPPSYLYPADQPLRLRRWHGRFTVTPPTAAVVIENGLQAAISGAFEVGDWWQIEARLSAPTPGTGEIPTRHGPLRSFAPLALVEPDGSRPEILEWLDEPFVSASRVSADTIHFDNTAALKAALPADDTLTLQAALDLMLTKGIGAVIVNRITRTFDGDIILGVWQMTVGDGSPGASFGDFNGPNAIQQAVAAVRALVNNPGDSWTLKLLVKRGTYVINDSAPIVLQANERLILEGDGGGVNLVPTASLRPGTVIECVGTTTACLDAVGVGSRLELSDLTLLGGTSGTTFGPGVARTAGELRIERCRLRNRSIILRGGADSAPPQHSLVLRDSELVTTATGAGLQSIRVEFPVASNGTCPQALVERCRATVPVDNSFVLVTSATNPVRFDGLTVRASTVTLGGSNTQIIASNPTHNPGLVAVQVASVNGSPATVDTLAIGDLVFENCTIDAGTATARGLFLHLPSGNDPNSPVRVTGIGNVIIRGGRWTIRSDNMLNAAIYVGDAFFSATASGTRIGNLVIEGVEMGWSSTSSSLSYATTLNTGHTLVFIADHVQVRDLSLFGTIQTSTQGELLVLGIERATLNGIRLEDCRAGGGGSLPASRMRLYASNAGLFASNISVIGVGNNADNGVIDLRSGGPAGQVGRRAVLHHCRVQRNDAGAGFFKSNDLDLELVDCSAVQCEQGVNFTQTVTGSTPSMVTIRGGTFTDNVTAGIHVLLNSNLAAVVVDGATCTGTQSGSGIHIEPGAFESWEDRGPTVVNNRVFGNLNPQILIGALTADRIGGVCVGNYCRGTSNGILQVQVQATYVMRGLTVGGIAPWASKNKNDADFQGNGVQMAFNSATWNQ